MIKAGIDKTAPAKPPTHAEVAETVEQTSNKSVTTDSVSIGESEFVSNS